jgi:Asp-tRNA(Asn)/Glu-tRNA(Gln) amidotransferase B subunit
LFQYFSELIVDRNYIHPLNNSIENYNKSISVYLKTLKDYCYDEDLIDSLIKNGVEFVELVEGKVYTNTKLDLLLKENGLLDRNELQQLKYLSPEYNNEANKIDEFLSSKFDLTLYEASIMRICKPILSICNKKYSLMNHFYYSKLNDVCKDRLTIINWAKNVIEIYYDNPFKDTNIQWLFLSWNCDLIEEKVFFNTLETYLKTSFDWFQHLESNGLFLEEIDDELLIDIMNKNPDKIEQYKNGNMKIIGFFIGQLKKQTTIKFDASIVNERFVNLINHL